MKYADQFAPYQVLASQLLPVAIGADDDASHDLSHLLRVWRNVERINAREGGDAQVLAAATLLHDCVDVAKDSPLRAQASRLAAQKAASVLEGLGWQADKIALVCHAIEAHSFSAQITPQSVEAKVLQDADRLDAIGHVGIARCFYVSGRLGRAIYDHGDPGAVGRPPDDLAFALDHFEAKLLRLAGSFQTETGQKLAQERHMVVQGFLEGFLDEVRVAGEL